LIGNIRARLGALLQSIRAGLHGRKEGKPSHPMVLGETLFKAGFTTTQSLRMPDQGNARIGKLWSSVLPSFAVSDGRPANPAHTVSTLEIAFGAQCFIYVTALEAMSGHPEKPLSTAALPAVTL